jgi:hypothetical protein
VIDDYLQGYYDLCIATYTNATNRNRNRHHHGVHGMPLTSSTSAASTPPF